MYATESDEMGTKCDYTELNSYFFGTDLNNWKPKRDNDLYPIGIQYI